MLTKFLFLILNHFKISAGCGVRTHADFHPPELESGALDHSAKPAFKIVIKIKFM